jgi:alkylhydroperoxidase family enzyme
VTTTGHPVPRLGREALAPTLRARTDPIEERLGYLGEFFTAAGHVPDAVVAFLDYTAACKAALPHRHNELLALRVSSRLGADYERIQHERLSDRLGYDRAWIAAAEGRPGADPALLDDTERDLVRLAEAVLERGGRDVDRELASVVAGPGPAAAVAALLQITRLTTVAALVHALRLELPRPSLFDEKVAR